MSFKEWSSAQTVQGKGKSADKSKVAPVAEQPVAQPDKTPADVAPAPKA